MFQLLHIHISSIQSEGKLFNFSEAFFNNDQYHSAYVWMKLLTCGTNWTACRMCSWVGGLEKFSDERGLLSFETKTDKMFLSLYNLFPGYNIPANKISWPNSKNNLSHYQSSHLVEELWWDLLTKYQKSSQEFNVWVKRQWNYDE